LDRDCLRIGDRGVLLGQRSEKVVPFEWASAKLAEREAFNRISEARTQAAWFNAWRTWAATVRKLHQQAKRPEPTSTPEFVSQDRGVRFPSS
jgi:hypothetical protein